MERKLLGKKSGSGCATATSIVMNSIVGRIVRYTLALVALVFAVYALTQVDYGDLSWSQNHPTYLVAILGITGCFNLVFFDVYNAVKRKNIKQ